MLFLQTFPSKHLARVRKSYTFASAFENERDKPNEQNEACFSLVMASGRIKRTTSVANATDVSLETSKQKKEFFEKDLHKTEK